MLNKRKVIRKAFIEYKNSFVQVFKPFNESQTGRNNKRIYANQICIPAGVMIILSGIILLFLCLVRLPDEHQYLGVLLQILSSLLLLISVYMLIKKLYDILNVNNWKKPLLIIKGIDKIVSFALGLSFGICYFICSIFIYFRDKKRLAIDSDTLPLYSLVFIISGILGTIVGSFIGIGIIKVCDMISKININEEVIAVLIIVVAIVYVTKGALKLWFLIAKRWSDKKLDEDRIKADFNTIWLGLFTLIIILSNVIKFGKENKDFMDALNCVYVIYVAWDLLATKHRESHFDVDEKSQIKEDLMGCSQKIDEIKKEQNTKERLTREEKSKIARRLSEIEQVISDVKRDNRKDKKIKRTTV